ncbi:MAG: cell division protein FtsQ/DivIB [Propionivibrio sp.]|uniref:Cell division protein FtsQ n=1 Tax=Candidatus Propionivibrio dominans TaxID=2954373 RepID=A0A9D7I794_9RHOO|nr:cell division protein FtsQ/DivIB [Candidatus Propionivibrio dominans]
MWNKPQLMNAVTDLLLVAAAAALLVAALVWAARLPLFPLREVLVTHELREVRRSELESSLSGLLRGNFFSIKVDDLRLSLEQLPWVRRAEVRRQWPSRIEVSIEEHLPVAFWGQATGQLVNSYGEVFTAVLSTPPSAPMPLLIGPTGLAPEILSHYQQAEQILKPVGRIPRALSVSPRLAVQLRLDDGMIVELGRQQPKAPVSERLLRFVEYYPSVLSAARQRPSVVDMRYPNGFALRLAAAPATESKGKP